jgi:hypothetical protein
METLYRTIDAYCERTGPELWSEPINAITNLAFIIAGAWGLREARRHGAGVFAELLCWWVVAIGIGSALFHTFANVLTVWMDVIPIATFTLLLTIFTLRRFVGLSRRRTALAFVAFYAVAAALTAMVPDWLREASNGTSGYLPAFLALTFFGFVLVLRRHPAGWYVLAAASIFIVSATFRSIDAEVCAALPIGTHFLWHVLNALMLGVLLASVAWYGRPEAATGTGRAAA